MTYLNGQSGRAAMLAVAAASALLTLASCGGGGGGDRSSGPASFPTSSSIQDLTNSQPPQETPANVSSRLAGVISRMDSLFASTWFEQPREPSASTLSVRSSCDGTTCRFEPQTGGSASFDRNDIEYDPTTNKTVLSKHGITMTRAGASYGSLMDHSVFSIFSDDNGMLEANAWRRFSYAGGALTGSRPSASATWHGIMVGVPIAAPGRNNFLQGDAILTYDFSGSSLDASFTNIKDITRNRAHSVPSVQFPDVPVASSGTFQFQDGTTGNRIQGGFYGPGHPETAGTFERSGIVGSFGVKRRP